MLLQAVLGGVRLLAVWATENFHFDLLYLADVTMIL